MDLLKKYIDEIGQDFVLDDFNLKEAQMRLPARKHFWVARLMDAKVKRNVFISKKKKLKKEVVKKVITDSPVRITQSAAESAAEKHESVSALNDSIEELNAIIEYLEKVEKIFSNMHWEIKNIVDINKMEQL
jgi:phenylalanyl-tRNA synthetase alpha subunit|tara:strand:+ start:43 stop:438 length:396 start_codon:yes stop_codon:yes gene_type:complete